MKVLAAVPALEHMSMETAESVTRMCLKGRRGVRVEPWFVKGYDVARARNEIARRALESYDFALMVDSDVVVPDNLLDYLLDPEADVVLAPYPRKNTKRGRSELFRLGAEGWGDDANIPIRELRSTGGRLDVKGGGMGCALIRSSVFSRIGYPWFEYRPNGDGAYLSEDFCFCRKAREAGIDIQADCRAVCGHLTEGVQYE